MDRITQRKVIAIQRKQIEAQELLIRIDEIDEEINAIVRAG